MIRAHRVNASAQDDASLVSGWNITPNVAYTLVIIPGAVSCGILLYNADGALLASGAALVGSDQPCVLNANGYNLGMLDAELGWHLLFTTTGTESQREIRINPAVDLPDEIHPVYADDDMALARATAAIDEAAHYRDDVTATCPLGLGAGLGGVVSGPVDSVPMIGQVESITWAATPDGTSEQAVVRRHVAIAPEVFVEPVPIMPPTVADDTGTTDAATTTSGNVFANDEAGLTIVAVNGLSASVGVAVDGSNGGVFTINSDGAWTFDPAGEFELLAGSETAATSVTYYASDGVGEAMATLTVTVSASGPQPWTFADITTSLWLDPHNPTYRNVISDAIFELYDNTANGKVIGQATVISRPALEIGAVNGLDVANYDGSNDFIRNMTMPFSQPVTYIAVCRVDSVVNNPALIDGSSTARNLTGFNTTRNIVMYAGIALTSSATITLGEWAIIATHFEGSASWCRLNGTEVISGNPGTQNVSGITIGDDFNGGNYLNGAHGVLAIIPGSDVLDSVQKAEGRIAHDYGLTALLPSGHPYKSAAPTI